jgi:hypothetical protein
MTAFEGLIMEFGSQIMIPTTIFVFKYKITNRGCPSQLKKCLLIDAQLLCSYMLGNFIMRSVYPNENDYYWPLFSLWYLFVVLPLYAILYRCIIPPRITQLYLNEQHQIAYGQLVLRTLFLFAIYIVSISILLSQMDNIPISDAFSTWINFCIFNLLMGWVIYIIMYYLHQQPALVSLDAYFSNQSEDPMSLNSFDYQLQITDPIYTYDMGTGPKVGNNTL